MQMHYRGHSGNIDETDIRGSLYNHQVMMRLLPYLGPHKKIVAVATAAMLVYTGSLVVFPWLIALAFAAVVDGELGRLTWILLTMGINALAGWAFNYVQLVLMARVGQNVLYNLRMDLFRHLQGLSLSFYDRNEVGRIMSRMQNDIIQLQEFLTTGILVFGDMLVLGGIIGAMLLMDVQLALVTLAVLPLLFLLLYYWQQFARRAYLRVRRAIAAVNASLQENIAGIRVVQSMGREDTNLQKFNRLNGRNLNTSLDASRLSSGVLPVVEIISALALALVIVYGGSLALGGDLPTEVLVAFAMYIQRFFEPVRNLTMQYTEVQRAMASGVGVFELMDVQPAIKDAPHATPLPTINGRLHFDHVSFSYNEGVEVLSDIDLQIEPGETIAVVGPTGGGKSTLVSLVARLYDVTEGRITIDGVDIRDVTRESLTRQVSTVLQDPFLFTGTVAENIRYGRLDATDQEIRDAATLVGADPFISRLPDGYNTQLHEMGSNLSSGQRQLVSFARAVIADPRILILDEATANIDTQTENLIQSALVRLLEGRTSLIIAHRLSTVRNASRIVVIDNGRIAEIGNHDELVNNGGVYARLHHMTMKAMQS